MTYDAEPYDLVIVGGGISGLQGLRDCLAIGLKVTVLEKRVLPGGKWTGHGIYECVQIQQHRDDFFLPGVPWPSGTPPFPTRDDTVEATERLIAENDLRPHIRCRSEVVSAVFDEASDVWTTTTSDGAVFTSRWIAWAVGTLGAPHFPRQVSDALRGFGGEVVHSSDYFRPTPYERQHVVVLGYGSSSVEIAQDLARNGACAAVTLVAPPKLQADGTRRGQDWCLSRALPGRGSRFCSDGQDDEAATLDARNAMVREAMKARHPKYPQCMHPELRPSGELKGKPAYPGVDGRPLGARVIVSEGFLDCVSEGLIATVPGYLDECPDALHVTVVHGDAKPVTLRADAVIVSTGYTPPTRAIAPLMRPAPSDCETLYQGLWMTEVPKAALIGHAYGFVAVPPFAGLQAKFLARVVSGAEMLPPASEMQAWVSKVSERFVVTQRLTENWYFRELRAAALGEKEAARAPTGAGPPAEPSSPPGVAEAAVNGGHDHGKRCEVVGAAIPGGGDADTMVATVASEALTYLDGARDPASSAPIGLVTIGGGSESLADELTGQMIEAERSLLQRVAVEQPTGSWAVVRDTSIDVLLCHGNVFESTPAEPAFVQEALRVLKPGAHAVLVLREASDASKAWLATFDAFERPSPAADSNDTAADPVGSRRRWRLVHKTVRKPYAAGGRATGMCRAYVFRATTSQATA